MFFLWKSSFPSRDTGRVMDRDTSIKTTVGMAPCFYKTLKDRMGPSYLQCAAPKREERSTVKQLFNFCPDWPAFKYLRWRSEDNPVPWGVSSYQNVSTAMDTKMNISNLLVHCSSTPIPMLHCHHHVKKKNNNCLCVFRWFKGIWSCEPCKVIQKNKLSTPNNAGGMTDEISYSFPCQQWSQTWEQFLSFFAFLIWIVCHKKYKIGCMVGCTVVNLMYTEDCYWPPQLVCSSSLTGVCKAMYDTQYNDVKSVTTVSNTNEDKQKGVIGF